ncbi:uncharacterized protein LOC132706610 [Cylas formicarius]|uniref:uncharacterized protein LOC132706610 n=1 Tax=Cylas formicarius TaxID=197179 RepID=UPI002958CC69|nr:uncharacterized protein LOC132706610 [Cylas formicarius]XP_060534037.1 uncharacterized protein LOC132706610 [Cylas formicarius]
MTRSSSKIQHGMICCTQIAIVILLLMILNEFRLSEGAGDSYLKRYYPDEPTPNKTRIFVQHPTKHRKKPQINKQVLPKENNTIVTAFAGTNAILKCNVELSNVSVIWVKHFVNSSDVKILTINSSTFVEDKRYLASNTRNEKIWTLHIRYTKTSDAGLYECQVCNSPTFSIYTQLHVYEAWAEIIGTKFGSAVRKVDEGDPIRLSCIINGTHHPIPRPTYMFWYHGNRMINYDLKDGAFVREGRLATDLIFPRALPQHAGNYSCVPSNAKQYSVLVIVQYRELIMPPESSGSLKEYSIAVLLLYYVVIIQM